MSGRGLTDDRFWESYWGSKDVLGRVGRSEQFHQLLADSLAPRHRSFIELGGFPGRYAVLARRHLGLEAAFVDRIVDPVSLERLLRANGLEPDDVDAFRADILEFDPPRPYDVVFSSGLVEHFDDAAAVVAAHARLAAPGGVVVITVPNFRGLNGLVQWCFDRENLRVHNLAVMDPGVLERIAASCGLERPEARWYGRLEVWLENVDRRALPLRWLERGVNAIGRRLPSPDSRLASGHLVLRAWKPGCP